MTCLECAELIISEICGEMDQEQSEHFRKHIEECTCCQKVQSEFRAIFGIVRQLPQREWDEKLRIKDMIRSRQRWRTIVFSKAAIFIQSRVQRSANAKREFPAEMATYWRPLTE